MSVLKCDIAILGGGIAGLFGLAYCLDAGYDAVLFETSSLGCGQTGFSQGILHAGLKYALTGKLSKAAQEVSDATLLWKDMMARGGVMDLSTLTILSKQHDACYQGRWLSSLKTLMSSRVLNSDASPYQTMPEVLENLGFEGSACAVYESVIDVPHLVRLFHERYSERICKVDECRVDEEQLHVLHQGTKFDISAKKTVLTNGRHISSLLPEAKTQLRPLNMVAMRLPNLPSLFLHVIGNSPKPLLTITTHRDLDGEKFWYLGGELAERGVGLSDETQFAEAKRYLSEAFPCLDTSGAQWVSIPIDRAEGKTPDGQKPDGPVCLTLDHHLAILPSKLVLGPSAGALLVQNLKQQDIAPAKTPNSWAAQWESPSCSNGIKGVFHGQAPLR